MEHQSTAYSLGTVKYSSVKILIIVKNLGTVIDLSTVMSFSTAKNLSIVGHLGTEKRFGTVNEGKNFSTVGISV